MLTFSSIFTKPPTTKKGKIAMTAMAIGFGGLGETIFLASGALVATLAYDGFKKSDHAGDFFDWVAKNPDKFMIAVGSVMASFLLVGIIALCVAEKDRREKIALARNGYEALPGNICEPNPNQQPLFLGLNFPVEEQKLLAIAISKNNYTEAATLLNTKSQQEDKFLYVTLLSFRPSIEDVKLFLLSPSMRGSLVPKNDGNREILGRFASLVLDSDLNTKSNAAFSAPQEHYFNKLHQYIDTHPNLFPLSEHSDTNPRFSPLTAQLPLSPFAEDEKEPFPTSPNNQ